MSIKRYSATKDATITNIYKDGLKVRATDANMGASDSLEVFSLYGRASELESEKSRILIYFPTNQIEQDRNNLSIGASGSCQFILKMSNVAHKESVPSKFTLSINAVSGSWDEGIGLDMESYKDKDSVNWISSSYGNTWTTEGGDFYNSPQFNKYFENGTEDLEVDITDVVEQWLSGTLPNNGLLLRMSSSIEDGVDSYYTKKFSSRTSEYFFKKPWIECRTDSAIKDDRAKFYAYNEFVPLEDNYNTIYIYNRFRGNLYDFPEIGTGSIYVALYTSMTAPLPTPLNQITGSTESPVSIIYATGSHVSTGIYKCDVCVNTNEEVIYDIWYNSDRTFAAVGGPIYPKDPEGEVGNVEDEFIYNVKNLKSKYSTKDQARIQVFSRKKNWNPNSYTSIAQQDNLYFPEDLYYKVFRIVDNYEVISYGTGSYHHTRLSSDKDGNYFDLEMSLLEPGYSYGLKFISVDRDKYVESKETFKFRVE